MSNHGGLKTLQVEHGTYAGCSATRDGSHIVITRGGSEVFDQDFSTKGEATSFFNSLAQARPQDTTSDSSSSFGRGGW